MGIIIARYMRFFPSLDPAWFYLHVFCQTSAYAIGVAGWGTGLKLGSQSKGVEYSGHRNIGIVLFSLATVQVCLSCIANFNPVFLSKAILWSKLQFLSFSVTRNSSAWHIAIWSSEVQLNFIRTEIIFSKQVVVLPILLIMKIRQLSSVFIIRKCMDRSLYVIGLWIFASNGLSVFGFYYRSLHCS